jgi:Zn finger protein HypA/HybF involved in hydrogenase expression
MRKDEASRKIIAVNVMKDFQWTRIVNIVANVGLVSIIDMGFQYVLPDFFISNRSLCLLCIIAVIYLANKKTPVIRNIIGFVGLCAFFTITHLNRIWLSMIITISQSFVISVIVEILNERIDKNNYRTIEGVDIKPGMILSHISVQDMQNCVDPALPRTTTETRRSRLTVSQAQAVRLWCKNAQRDVTIVEMLPFAPFIAVATIIHIVRFIVVYK